MPRLHEHCRFDSCKLLRLQRSQPPKELDDWNRNDSLNVDDAFCQKWNAKLAIQNAMTELSWCAGPALQARDLRLRLVRSGPSRVELWL